MLTIQLLGVRVTPHPVAGARRASRTQCEAQMIDAAKHPRTWILLVFLLLQELLVLSQSESERAETRPRQPSSERNGQHEFDFEIGTWKTHLSRRLQPLSGSSTWVEYEGTSVVRKVWGGRANLLELDVSGPAGRIETLSLRLYNPESRQWSLHFANSRTGALSTPAIGEFRNGRGEFLSQETFNGRSILVRFVITRISDDSWRFEQSFSDDGGRTWESNWIAVDERIDAEPGDRARRSEDPSQNAGRGDS